MVPLQVLTERIKSYHPSADVEVLEKAYLFAEHAHREQLRKSGDPFFLHPTRVAELITELRLDTASVCAGLLHDVVEDTATTVAEIEAGFGTEIATLVDGLTKLSQINFVSREDRQAENFRKMVIAMAKDLRVLLVKLCDRLDNMRSLQFMPPASQERIARETFEIYAPLANRLGMRALKAELEDLSLCYLEPEAFGDISKRLAATNKERERYIGGLSKTLVSLLGKMGFASTVHGRAKHITSIYRKMKSQQCEFDQLYDLLAFRICVESTADCYAALGVVHSKWTPIPGRFKDYVALPKPNRYQSLHTAVLGPGQQRIEIQIRTHEMHRVAEYGVAAHWRFKESEPGGMRPEDAAKYSWLRELAAFQENLKDPAEFVESVKIDLFPDEVYVFTPKGEVRVFPRGATPIDFAYSIHTEVGDHCAGARANGRIVPIRYRLRSGDVLEVLTSADKQPSKDWLDYCATTRARTQVRSYLRAEHRTKSINLGRELLETEMHSAGMSLVKLSKNDELLKRLLSTHHVDGVEELYLIIGFGRIDAAQVVQTMTEREDGAKQDTSELKAGAFERLVRKVRGRDQGGIRVSGVDNVLVRYAKCCNPVHGESIIGFITRGRGITVHRRECDKAFNSDPERRIEVSWNGGVKAERPVSVRVITHNSPGILATVSQTFSEQKLNIIEANCRARDDATASNVFTFSINDVSQLRSVMRALNKIRGVVEVERV